MSTITGNDERDAMLFAAIKKAMSNGQMLSLGNVAKFLPADFDLYCPASL